MAEDLWPQILERVRTRLGAGPSYQTMFVPSRLLSLESGVATIEVPNAFMRDKMRQQQHDALLLGILSELTGSPHKLALVIPAASPVPAPEGVTLEQAHQQHAPGPSAPLGQPVMGPLNPKYTFETFVVGSHNQLAHAAAKSVADALAKTYNPLFIWGGSGLGKTHLMHAIAHQVLAQTPHLKVAYLSAERFTNDMISSIREREQIEFKARYRSIDLMLIDDIQFLSGKEGTQEEFFHTFNALHNAGKQIIICSDRPPKEIAKLEDRLKTRFEWGLTVDVQVPNFETRIAILQKKAEMEGHLVSDAQVFPYIAQVCANNVRELEGALTRVSAIASMSNRPISLPVVQEILGGEYATPRQLDADAIIKAAGEHFQLPIGELVGSRRTKDISHARQVAMYLCRELTDMSLNVIGSKFGGRDHTTVMHAIEKIRAQLPKDPRLTGDIQRLQQTLKV